MAERAVADTSPLVAIGRKREAAHKEIPICQTGRSGAPGAPAATFPPTSRRRGVARKPEWCRNDRCEIGYSACPHRAAQLRGRLVSVHACEVMDAWIARFRAGSGFAAKQRPTAGLGSVSQGATTSYPRCRQAVLRASTARLKYHFRRRKIAGHYIRGGVLQCVSFCGLFCGLSEPPDDGIHQASWEAEYARDHGPVRSRR